MIALVSPFVIIFSSFFIYIIFSENFNKVTTNSTIDEYVMHHIHQTDSQIYDYIGEENYDASYIMADIDLGPKVNVVTGVRRETNETLYYSNESSDHALPHWVYIGESVSYKRTNTYNLPALFLKFKPLEWLDVRYANTTTLTRPDYISLVPSVYPNIDSVSAYGGEELDPPQSQLK